MTLTASDVTSLSESLSRWEIGEYICAAFVTIACAGEYVADFTNWFTGGIRERKERLAKRSTLLLIVALSLELICLVRTNILSGMLIGSLSEKAEEADRKAKTALTDSATALAQSDAAEKSSRQSLDQSGKATASASSALGIASGARKEADSFEKDIVSAKKQATEAESHLADALRQAADAERAVTTLRGVIADRTLTLMQQDRLVADLAPFSGTTIDVATFGDTAEISGLGRLITDCLTRAGWTVHFAAAMSGQATVRGILVGTRENSDAATAKAAALPISSLQKQNLGAGPWLFEKLIWPSAFMGAGNVKYDAPIRMFIGSKP